MTELKGLKKIITFADTRYKLIAGLVFLLIFITGLSIFSGYGISYDEHIQRNIGWTNINYFEKGDQSLVTMKDRYYGPAFEILLAQIEKSFGIQDKSREIYLMRHIINFFIYYAGVVVFYFLCKKRFRSWKAGLLGSIFLILSPRIFSESFYNSKDIPFMSLFLISIFTLYNFLDKKNTANAIIHSFVCALTIDIRIMGILIPLITAVFFIIDLFVFKKNKETTLLNLRNFLLYFFITIFLTVLFFPTSWTNPIYNFGQSFKIMSQYAWRGYNLYLGDFIRADHIPWHYSFVWILITTPLAYILFFLAGVYYVLKAFLKDPLDVYKKNSISIINILILSMSIGAIIILKSVLYGGWRQIYFIYPCLIFISIEGLHSAADHLKNKKNRYTGLPLSCRSSFNIKLLFNRTITVIICLILITSMMYSVITMAVCYPYEYIYYNFLAGWNLETVKQAFPLDYWGISYREGLEYILKSDTREKIKVFTTNNAARWNYFILDNTERERLNFVDSPDEAEYFIGDFINFNGKYNLKNIIYEVKIKDTSILVISKNF
ncbi:MAG: hypothetical protein M1308_16740 [Actinobacteria bacterium]|nr:hypothetical protein [Actinomycetota bacterium]